MPRMKLRDLLLAAAALVAATLPAAAGSLVPAMNLRLDHGSVWQANTKQSVTEGFLQIHNDGPTDDTLTGWNCPAAGTTTLVDKDGKPLDHLTIPAGKTVTLSPDGLHLVLGGLLFPIERGSILPCSFTFTQAGELGGFLNEVKRPRDKG